MVVLRVLLFALFFTFDLTIKARATEIVALPLSLDVTQEPSDCLKKHSLCAIKTGNLEKFRLKMGTSELIMDQKTTLVRIDSKTARLVSGTLWIKPHGDLTIESEYGSFSAHGEYWLSKIKDTKLYIVAFKSDVDIFLRGYKQTVTIPRGFETWVSEVNNNGYSTMGIPAAIDLERHLETWARLYSGNRNMFFRDFKQWYPIWQQSVTQSSQMHHDIIQQRTLALAEERKAQEEKKIKIETENRRLRDRFRHKVLFE